MIEFLTDHTTREPKPQVFAAGERVERLGDTEAFFVRLGVAAFVGEDGELNDGEGRLVAPLDDLAIGNAPGARGGELAIGVDAPQRATTGPGNAVLFGGDQQARALQADNVRLADALDAATGELASARETQAGHDAAVKTLTEERDAAHKRADAAEKKLAAAEKKLAEHQAK